MVEHVVTAVRRLSRAMSAALLGSAVLGVTWLGAPDHGVAVRPTVDRSVAVLRGLDKITARVVRMEVEVDRTAEFGTLAITLRACRGTTPEEPPENAAFLEIEDEPPGESPIRVFSGWMFSSSPAISALDHPVYDVWVVECVEALSPVDDGGEPVPRLPLPEAPPVPRALPDARQPT